MQLAHAFGLVAEPDAAAIPVHLAGDDVADDVLFLDLLEGLKVAVLVTALQTDHDFEILFIGDFGHLQHFAHARASAATGFSMNTCLPALTAASKW
jgi:hypothetical protein